MLGAAWCLLVLGEHRRCAHPLLTDDGEKRTEGRILLGSLGGGASFKTGIVDEVRIGAAAEVLPVVGQTGVIPGWLTWSTAVNSHCMEQISQLTTGFAFSPGSLTPL